MAEFKSEKEAHEVFQKALVAGNGPLVREAYEFISNLLSAYLLPPRKRGNPNARVSVR
jgi:hypothetical protein